jgi:hypothetical protein
VLCPEMMRNPFASRSGGVVAGAPQPPANVCDPSRGQEDASMLYPGGITEISRGLSEATPPDRDTNESSFFIPEG